LIGQLRGILAFQWSAAFFTSAKAAYLICVATNSWSAENIWLAAMAGGSRVFGGFGIYRVLCLSRGPRRCLLETPHGRADQGLDDCRPRRSLVSRSAVCSLSRAWIAKQAPGPTAPAEDCGRSRPLDG